MQISNIKYFNLPLDILEYTYFKKYEKALVVFLYLKSKSDGILNKTAIDFTDLKNATGIKDKRTFKKHLNTLQEINFIGYSKVSGNYFIRGFKAIGGLNKFNNKRSVRIPFQEIKYLKSFMEAAIISKAIRAQKYATEKEIIKLAGQAALKNGRAIQAYRLQKGYPLYYGLSNEGIAKILKISKSHGNRAKLIAEKNGYLKTNKKEEIIAILSTTDYNMRNNIVDNHKILFSRLSNGSIKVFKQLHDEIISLIEFSRRRS